MAYLAPKSYNGSSTHDRSGPSRAKQALEMRCKNSKQSLQELYRSSRNLLKHLVISKYCNVPWSRSTISRDANGKPCFIPEGRTSKQLTMDFNVSHQAGIVSLIASVGFKEKVQVGTDVVCANERQKQDYAHIEKQGFFDWVDMHGDVFAESELNHMKLSPVSIDLDLPDATLDGFAQDSLSRCQWRNGKVNVKVTGANAEEMNVQVDSNTVIDKKLRRFYAMWCLREAYVKMTGEALLAPWLKDLEISDVQAPAATKDIQSMASLEEGDTGKDFTIYFKGKKVTDVNMELSALGSDFMVAGSVKVPKGAKDSELAMGRWRELNLEDDILAVAERAS